MADRSGAAYRDRRDGSAHPGESALRTARRSVRPGGATLEQVCADLDSGAPHGSCGLTPSMLSEYERGIHHPGAKNRALLARYYNRPEHALFEREQDPATATVLVGYPDLHRGMLEVVTAAEHHLVVVGSRSRDRAYLAAIEHALTTRPTLVHYRILFGPPRHRILSEHLQRLLEIRDPTDRSHGWKTLHIAIIEDPDLPERFFCASEHAAITPIPSVTTAAGFDTGIRLGPDIGARYIDHTRQLYAAGRPLETHTAVAALLQ